MITVWVVVLVTVDRYIAICHPLKGKLRTVERAQRALAAVVLIALVYNIPMFFERDVVPKSLSPCSDQITLHVDKTMFRSYEEYFLAYKTISYFIFRSGGPLIVLMTLNAKLMYALREMRRRHRYMTRSSRQRENVTLTLVVVVTVFIVCDLPDACFRIAVAFLDFSSHDHHADSRELIEHRVSPVVNALLAFNSSVNFLIYCLIGKKFRRILARMCTKGCYKETRPELLTYNATASQSQTVNSYALTNLQSNGSTQVQPLHPQLQQQLQQQLLQQLLSPPQQQQLQQVQQQASLLNYREAFEDGIY